MSPAKPLYAAFLAACLVASGCVVSSPSTATAVIGPGGGTLSLTSGPGAGASITVPPGALSEDVTLRVSVAAPPMNDLPAEGVPAGPAIQFGPPGTPFAIPVTITVPVTPEAAALMTRPEDGSTGWTLVPGASFDPVAGQMSASVSHFSFFVGTKITLNSLQITPASASIKAGFTQPFTATGIVTITTPAQPLDMRAPVDMASPMPAPVDLAVPADMTGAPAWSAASLGGALAATSYRGVWGTSASDIWAVGTSGVAAHYNGATWTALTAQSGKATLYGVWGTSAGNVWAVGEGGAIVNWNGMVWIAASGLPAGLTGDLYAVHGTSASDVWVVGAGGTIVRWNGMAWSRVTSNTTNNLRGIWAGGPGSVWVVGDKGTILGCDPNMGCSPVSSGVVSGCKVAGDCPTGTRCEVSTGACVGCLAASDCAAGQACSSGQCTCGTSAECTSPRAPACVAFRCPVNTPEHLNAVWGADTKTIYAVGAAGTIVRYDNVSRTWNLVTGYFGKDRELRGVFGGAGAPLWAVGTGGAIQQMVGTAWSLSATGTTANLNAVWQSSPTDVWVVGDNGTILRSLPVMGGGGGADGGTVDMSIPVDMAGADGGAVDMAAACVPRCDGLSCGPDGCGGTCGTCAMGQSCQMGLCVTSTQMAVDLTTLVTWSSSDPKIATCFNNPMAMTQGVCTGVGPGTAVITATIGGYSATAKLTVIAPMPTCKDGMQNGKETDTDCGGGQCSGCANGKKCAVGTDCASGRCAGGTCAIRFNFSAPQAHTVGASPQGMALGDLNYDGFFDLVVADGGDNNISVLLGKGDGTFQPFRSVAVGGDSQAVAIGDLNADGKPDVAVGLPAGSLVVLLGRGDGTFQAGVPYAARSPASVAIADLNLDGRPDLVSASGADTSVTVLLGKGDGSFQAPQTISTTVMGGAQSWVAGAVAVGDLNGDGKPDVATVNSVLMGKGDGTFQPPVGIRTYGTDIAVILADVTRDGKLDLITADYLNSSYTALPGKGDGTFNLGATLPASVGARGLALGDFDGDGQSDLITTSNRSYVLNVLFNRGGVFFAKDATNQFACGNAPYAVVAGDLNGDGKPDLIVSNPFSAQVSVLLNTRP